ncbi:isochorismatase family protein [Streptomyces hainanensis]|uniref:Isochorismatase family protein n=1 Tax=Streptomyces hainanensis TaxID=402648 RepID=A0A4R4TP01_9ACTN|nr:isochorismatase family protein [Streptomyces hainanensis]TDC75819.1 isochorismatase family protein [Streptomyces hainanensis]
MIVDAVIVVDMQQGVLAGGAEPVAAAATLTDRVVALLGRARLAGAPVIHLQNDGAPGATDEPFTPGWELVLNEPAEPVVRKTEDDGFAGTPLGALLDGHGVRRVAVCGVLSEMCVSATARTALARGLGVVLPHDTHGTYPLDEIPADVVARVAEHALGDEVELVAEAAAVTFAPAG